MANCGGPAELFVNSGRTNVLPAAGGCSAAAGALQLSAVVCRNTAPILGLLYMANQPEFQLVIAWI